MNNEHYKIEKIFYSQKYPSLQFARCSILQDDNSKLLNFQEWYCDTNSKYFETCDKALKFIRNAIEFNLTAKQDDYIRYDIIKHIDGENNIRLNMVI